ncbi:MAG: hypothetical protein VB080_10570 [Propionicimonas sp.]|uniref:hypothetical protein n=1 Tax=Propionicimonas sp. TaxID=1955623 RepID=UPI002B1FC63B|nr:hypothetical protein [Propionicimonas sp.]MEA4944862.1 hypothetical protein [Propionicimonas sp.]MEA5055185.1 hypothetical protein [Propionicimonas sp.]MEA5116468.1 hypothetical protein [Propionicimonas sp.]
MTTDFYSGPVDFAVFVVPLGARLQDGFRALIEQVARGAIELLDLEIIGVANGEPVRLAFADLAADGEARSVDLAEFESDVLQPDDLAAIAGELPPEHVAIAVIYEDRSLAEVAAAWGRHGGLELWAGGVDITDLAASLAELPEEEN